MSRTSINKSRNLNPSSSGALKSQKKIQSLKITRPSTSYELDFDSKISAKQNQQYEALAIKLGLMPKKMKVSSSKKIQGQTKINKPKLQAMKFGKTSNLSKQLNSKADSIKQNNMKQANYQSRSIKRQNLNQLDLEQTNPYAQLQNKIWNNFTSGNLDNKQQIEKIYSSYIRDQKPDSGYASAQTDPQIMNQSTLKTQKTINRLQISLNQLINKFCKEQK